MAAVEELEIAAAEAAVEALEEGEVFDEMASHNAATRVQAIQRGRNARRGQSRAAISMLGPDDDTLVGDIGLDDLEAEQLELVGAMDSLAREKAALQAELRGLRDEIRTRDVQLAAQELVGSAKAGGGRSSGGSGGGGSRSSFSGGRSSSDGSLGRPGPGMLERTLSRPFGRSRSDGKEVSL